MRLGISSCLLGRNVRFDGGHKRDAFLVGTIGRFVEWVAVCPEVEMGLGFPRETLSLQRRGGDVRFVMPKSGVDHTDAMRVWAGKRLGQLARADLDGYVLKKDSPSCGLERVRVYDQNGVPARTGRGVFAEALLRRFPALPVEDEGRLADMRLRERFVRRVFAYHRLKVFFSARWTLGGLVIFHTAQKLLLMAHSPEAYRRIGRLVARGKGLPRGELREAYQREFMGALAAPASRRRHANALQHVAGYLSKQLSGEERLELAGLIEDYRKGLVPLVVPLTLVRHHARRFGVAYLQGQAYLEPHPKELMLLNHV